MKPSRQFSNAAVQLVHSGEEFFAMLESLIRQVAKEIQLQFYIFEEDQAGSRIQNALLQAAARGVSIYLLIDGYEARSLSADFVHTFNVPNIHLAYFEPLFRSKTFYLGRRMHHKIAVFDNNTALVGGINIADRYMGTGEQPAWLDFAIFLQGPVVKDLRENCLLYWKDATGISVANKNQVIIPEHHPSRSLTNLCSVRIRRNDWVKGLNQVWKSYFSLFNQATDHIIIMCSYFLPGWIFLKSIKKAVARGVKVQVILAGISDVMLAKHAERYLYRWMLRNGVEIYEYKGSVLHAKIAVRDNKWMTIGSYNVNNISALASIECNVDVRNKPFVSKVTEELRSIAENQSERITYQNFNATQNLYHQFWQWVCYQLIKIVLFLATFYFRRDLSGLQSAVPMKSIPPGPNP